MSHSPSPSLPENIGKYKVIKSLGGGGMGEVFLVQDPSTERNIALKRILPSLLKHQIIKNRFIREAQIASSLSHPSIIPIYSFHQDENEIFYTMPYIEGETLKDLLQKHKDIALHHTIDGKETKSLPSLKKLISYFQKICQAISYAQSKNILHRDLKLENIIVGKSSDVFILDWGISGYINEKEDFYFPHSEEKPELTNPNKLIGTLNYMSPERAKDHKATISSEIYALGVILYLILTLKFPFKRKSLSHFKQICQKEHLISPEDLAPDRDIPKILSKITQKCLAPNPHLRYQSIYELSHDLENYIDGRPEWHAFDTLDTKKGLDWEFQENVPLTKRLAFSNALDHLEWCMFMVSSKSYPSSIRIDFEVSFKKGSDGFGVMMNVPNQSTRETLDEGYCLWIGGPEVKKIRLFRHGAEVISADIDIEKTANSYTLEKVDNHIRLFVNGRLVINFISYLPIRGHQIGLLYKKPLFTLSSLNISVGSESFLVNCLSTGDEYFDRYSYDKAHEEYLKIAKAFMGRPEGRDALFRAGLAIIQQIPPSTDKDTLAEEAFSAFEKLRKTPDAPLEYLGKSLVYQSLEDTNEEVKCLELALRKFPEHTRTVDIKNQIIFRMHESAKNNKNDTYLFTLLALRLIPDTFSNLDHKALLSDIMDSLKQLSFLPEKPRFSDSSVECLSIANRLAFELKLPEKILQIIGELPEKIPEKNSLIKNAMICLKQLGIQLLRIDNIQDFQEDKKLFEFIKKLDAS